MSSKKAERQDRTGCTPHKSSRKGRISNLADIVRDYMKSHRNQAAQELRGFEITKSLGEAIERAGMARNQDGKRFDHQRRIGEFTLKKATRRLLQARDRIKACRDFEELFQLVRSIVESIEGIGELHVYDTSLRIGAKLGLSPEAVYLHAGTREGAENLGLNTRGISLPLESLPEELQLLQPREIEDVLCIYKKEFESFRT